MVRAKRKRGVLLFRVWLVLFDHSIAGAFRTKREAQAFARLRQRGSIEDFVVGPYVLQWKRGPR